MFIPGTLREEAAAGGGQKGGVYSFALSHLALKTGFIGSMKRWWEERGERTGGGEFSELKRILTKGLFSGVECILDKKVQEKEGGEKKKPHPRKETHYP